MAVGIAKEIFKYREMKYKDLPSAMPEEAYLAQRVLTNQVEQMTVLVVGSLSCALFVDGKISGVMSLVWVMLRCGYALIYRKAIGVPVSKIGLTKFTIPAYYMSNGMVMATTVHAIQSLLSGA
jgi:hypothetical protein